MPLRASDSTARPVRLRLFDSFALEVDGCPIELRWSGQRIAAFLALRGCSLRTTVAGWLWPEVAETAALSSLRTALWRLPTCADVVDRAGQALALAPNVRVDTRDFDERAGTLLGPATQLDDLKIYELRLGGVLLPGWDDAWLTYERERLRQARFHALEIGSGILADRGHLAAALDLAIRAIALDPLRESAHRLVITLHLREGNIVEARRHLAELRELMFTELGLPLSPDFENLVSAAHLDGGRLLR
jgi:DNA-binding SARP family transcriptional activator